MNKKVMIIELVIITYNRKNCDVDMDNDFGILRKVTNETVYADNISVVKTK